MYTPEESKIILNHLEEEFQVANANKKSEAPKDGTSIPLPPDGSCSKDESSHHSPDKAQASDILKTPLPAHRKRRNSLESPWGLSIRSKTSISDLKAVAASLESDLTELNTELSNVKATHDLCASKFSFLEDKITQLDNDYKVQIKSLASRMIDVETTNEHLQSENTKLKTEMQNLKALDKKIDTIGNEKKHSSEEKNVQTNIPVCQQSLYEPSEISLASKSTSPDNNLTSNPFHVLALIKDADDNNNNWNLCSAFFMVGMIKCALQF